MKDDNLPIKLFFGAVLACVLLTMCAGCVARPPREDVPAVDAAACAPLPLCAVPPKASSTQLETALWECVLEYRALYSVCYNLSHDKWVGNADRR